MDNLQQAESADDYEKLGNRDGLVFYLDHTLDNIEVFGAAGGSFVAAIGKANFKELAESL